MRHKLMYVTDHTLAARVFHKNGLHPVTQQYNILIYSICESDLLVTVKRGRERETIRFYYRYDYTENR